MNTQIEENLKQLKNLEGEINTLEELKTKIRQDVFETLEKEQMAQYKTKIATVSYTERKTIKMDTDKVLEQVKDLPKYFDVIPEHKELNKKLTEDIKDKTLELEGVELITKKSPMIRFNK